MKTIAELRKNLNIFMSLAKDDRTPPTKYRYAKVSGFSSFKEMQRQLRALGEEGTSFLDEIDNEIYIWMIDWLARSKTRDDIAKRKQILEISGLNTKQTIEVAPAPISHRVEMDNTMAERVKSITSREIQEEPLTILGDVETVDKEDKEVEDDV